jgi:hypothetical protein
LRLFRDRRPAAAGLAEPRPLVVWTIVNLEFWDIARPMARQVLPAPTGQVLLPDVPNWTWHEYGMRVGVWRFFELFARLAIRPTLSINARVCEEYERVARAARNAGWEFMGHAWEQMPIHKVEDQFAMINQSLEMLERFTGTRPVGWLGPGLTETMTPKGASQFIFPNGTILRFDLAPGQYLSGQGPHITWKFPELETTISTYNRRNQHEKAMRYNFNVPEKAAKELVISGRPRDAIKIYLFMADGDQSLDGGYLGKKLGECYEMAGDLHAAKYWYGRAVEENPEARLDCIEARKRLAGVSIDDLVPPHTYILP